MRWAALTTGAMTLAWAAYLPDGAAASPPGEAARDQLPLAGEITNPDWVAKPSGDDLSNAFPPLPRMLGLGGHVRMQCQVAIDGSLGGCIILQEMPAGIGFGEASLSMADRFKMRPQTVNGEPVSGASIIIPLTFAAPADNPPPSPAPPSVNPKSLALARELAIESGASDVPLLLLRRYLESQKEQNGPPDTAEAKLAYQAMEQAVDQLSTSYVDATARDLAANLPQQTLTRLVVLFKSPAYQAWRRYGEAASASQTSSYQYLYGRAMADARDAFCAQVACFKPASN